MTESNLCCWNRTQGGTDQNYLPGWSYQTSRIFTYPSMAQCTVLFQNLTSPSLLCSGSWDSSNDIIHFQYQRIQVQIQSLSVFFTINCKGTTNREKKRSAAKGHFKKFLFNSLSRKIILIQTIFWEKYPTSTFDPRINSKPISSPSSDGRATFGPTTSRNVTFGSTMSSSLRFSLMTSGTLG